MQYFIIGLIFLLGITDGFLLIAYAYNTGYAFPVLAGHIMIGFIVYGLIRKFLDYRNGVPNYLCFILPCLGEIMVALLYLSLTYFQNKSIVLGDYERYINFERYHDIKEKPDYGREMRTLSFLDQMNLLNPQVKKELIIDFGMTLTQYDKRVKILKHGLTDMDSEVQHYAAVSINMLENEYTYLINQFREEFNTNKDLDSLKKLARVYQSYLDSGLLIGEIFQVFNHEYVEVLLKLSGLQKENYESLNELVRAYIRSGDYLEAEEVNQKMLIQYPDKVEGIINNIKITYEKRDFVAVNQLITELIKKKADIPQEYKTNLSFWTAKEEIQ
ncbi:tetratricopeptide repeat protein [Phosphitispora sp. TUW77]|uniref:tetratricopeptide repeat protein n=1 Tax=Phosphitispora sp. TUW77 TaxID=3152361 RepID=UPI003AB1EF3A